MIERLEGEHGQPTFRRDGRLLASRFDPWGEARAWVQRRSAFFDKVETIFVLGVGAGYHVLELAKATKARVVVLDSDADLIEAVSAAHDFTARGIRLECVTSLRELRASPLVRQSLVGSHLVLVHAPSRAGAPELFDEWQNQLRGRDWGALNWAWQLKGYPSFDSQPRIAGGGEALTIYDLEQTELVQDSTERTRLLLKALRELVK